MMIQIKNLQKIQNGSTLLDIEEILVNPGEVTAIVGTAESGLKLLMQLLLGRDKPSAGHIQFNDLTPRKNQAAYAQKVGVLFEENALYTHQSVEGNLLFFAQINNLPKIRALDILEQIGLADQASLKAGQLSSGLQRRLAFGRALLNKPPCLLLEKPFKGCDETSIHLIKRLILQYADKNASILIFNDDTAHLTDICQKIFVLKQGKVVDILEKGKDNLSDATPFKIPVKLEGRVALINPGHILFVEAFEGKTVLQTFEEKLPTQFTLNELEERLKPSGFFRAHRSFLVNLQHVQEVIPYSRNSYSLRLSDADSTEIPLSKTSAAELRELLGY